MNAPTGRLRGSGVKNATVIRTYALLAEPPTQLSYSAHPIKFLGYSPFKANPDLVWGVHGTASHSMANTFASLDAKHSHKRLYQIDLLYRVAHEEGTDPESETMSAGLDDGLDHKSPIVEVPDFIHFTRLLLPARDLVHKQLLACIDPSDEDDMEEVVKWDFDELLRQRPMLVHELMRRHTEYNIFVHPVKLNGGATLRIATARRTPNDANRVIRVFTRFHDEIPTTL